MPAASATSGLESLLIDNVDDLRPYLEEWDELAAASGRPYCCPAWMLAWWRHMADDGAELRIVMVREDGRLVAVAPFFAARWRGMGVYRLLCSGTSTRIGLLPAEGASDAICRAVMERYAAATPAPHLIRFEGIKSSSPWPSALALAWPDGPAHQRIDFELDAPIVSIDDGYDAWLAERSKNFRGDFKRKRRRLEERGAAVRLSSPERLDKDLHELFRLHYARWSDRGGSGNLDTRVEAMLRDAARALAPSGRFRLFILEANGEAIGADLYIDAGGWAAYWGGGFDDAWAKFSPGIVTHIAAIEDSARRGLRRVDFGEGEEHYKRAIARADEPVAWITLFPPGARLPLSWLQMLPYDIRNRTRTRLRKMPATRQRIRRLRAIARRVRRR